MNSIKAPSVKNNYYYILGALIIFLNWLRHRVKHYDMARPFSPADISRAVEYDFRVVDDWLKNACDYTKNPDIFKEKVVLELGPGPDLGVAMILLAQGIRKYISLDCFELISSTPDEFYEVLLADIQSRFGVDIKSLERELRCIRNHETSAIEYLVDKNFSFSKIKEKIDIFVATAAFEHFSDIEKTLKDIDAVAQKGAILISVVDLQTHTKVIRDRDPLNIYRYGQFFWDTFKFQGSPNRRRTFEYARILEKLGWDNIISKPSTVLDLDYIERVRPTLSKEFRNMDPAELRILSYVLMATKK